MTVNHPMRRQRRHCLLMAAAACGLAGPLSAQAQIDKFREALGGLGSALGGLGSGRSGQSDNIVRTYIAADREVLRANGDMAEALGLKDAAALARATADALGDAATVDGLKEADKVVTDSSQLIQQELDKAPQLDEAAKQMFAAGLVKLVRGVIEYRSLRKSVQRMADGASAFSVLQGGGLGTMAYIGSNLPSGLTHLGTALQNTVAFAQNNDIPVPADATQALAAL